MKITIAVPSKGRISEPSLKILDKAGLGLKDNSNRKLISATFNRNIDVMFARASDIPKFVENGIVDMGITGYDLIKESSSDVERLVDLNFGKTSLVIASPEDSDIESAKDLKDDMIVATEFPNLTQKYLDSLNLKCDIVELSGSTEVAPAIGIADVITDLTSTGETLKMNHLKVIDTILDSSIYLITNKKALKEKNSLIEPISTAVKGVIEAERKKLVLMNVARKYLEDVQDVLTMRTPTVSEVLSEEETVAIQVVIDEDDVFELINDLRNAGARDILVMPIERII